MGNHDDALCPALNHSKKSLSQIQTDFAESWEAGCESAPSGVSSLPPPPSTPNPSCKGDDGRRSAEPEFRRGSVDVAPSSLREIRFGIGRSLRSTRQPEITSIFSAAVEFPKLRAEGAQLYVKSEVRSRLRVPLYLLLRCTCGSGRVASRDLARLFTSHAR